MTKLNRLFYSAACALLMGGMMMTAMGCPETEGKDAKATTVEACSEYNNDEVKCKLATQKDNKMCFWKGKGQCEVFVIADPKAEHKFAKECSYYGKDETECGKDIRCDFNATDKTCETAQNPSDCKNVKDKDVCDDVYGAGSSANCKWDAATKTCEKGAPALTDIFTWKSVATPAPAAAAANAARTPESVIKKLVMSKDKANLYVIGGFNGEEGIYWSNDSGNTWTLVGNAAGVIDGIPIAGANAQVALNARAAINNNPANIELKPTATGAVVHDKVNHKLALLVAGASVWGLDHTLHNSTLGNPNAVAGFDNAAITFVDIVKDDGTEMVFGQGVVATFFKVPTNNTAGAVLATAAPGGAKFTVNVAAPAPAAAIANKIWSRAGYTKDGDLLLWSAVNNHRGVFHIPAANLAAAGNAPRVSRDAAVIFPEAAGGAGVEWVEANNDVTFVGSLADGATERFFAGMKTAGERAGLAHHAGPQVVGGAATHASLSFSGIRLLEVIDYDNAKRVVTADKGILGLANNGTWDKTKDIDFALASGTEKMDGSNDPVSKTISPSTHAPSIRAIYEGLQDKTYIHIDGEGVFVRTKSQGQPRP